MDANFTPETPATPETPVTPETPATPETPIDLLPGYTQI
jgi:hypothetical protein